MQWKKPKNSYTLISSLDIPYTYKHLWIELPLNCRQFSCIETRFIGIGLHRHDVNHDENLGIKSTMKCYRILWVIKYHPGSSTKDFSYSAIHKIAQQTLPTGCFFTMGWNLFCKEHSHLYDKQKSSMAVVKVVYSQNVFTLAPISQKMCQITILSSIHVSK